MLPGLIAAAPVKIGVLAFGTVNWELQAIKDQGLDKKYGLNLQVQLLASPESGKIALQGDNVDMIATDWIWVAHQNQSGHEYRFIPYSTHAGALMVPAGSNIQSVADLPGKKLGIAGGPLDKNWLLLRAYAQQNQIDLDKTVEKVFAAPPLLNQQMETGKLDAILDFWHFAAKLEAQGFQRLLDGRDVITGLGIPEAMPNLGYVFKKSWAEKHDEDLQTFLKASGEARSTLCQSDEAWEKILPLTQEKDPKNQAALRREYCQGVVKNFAEPEKQAIAKIYKLLHKIAGEQLTGKSEELPQDIFWP